MSKVSSPARPKPHMLAALLGAAALAASAPAEAPAPREDKNSHHQPTHQATLGGLIEQRAAAAERARRYDDLDRLTTLWLSLEHRDQLDREVSRADQFVNVSLRNQKRSEHRAESRALRRSADSDELELPAIALDPGQALDAEKFVASLEEPYRSAVQWTLTGMNHREVAEKMGASHAAVRKWAQRLRDRLSDDGWEPV